MTIGCETQPTWVRNSSGIRCASNTQNLEHPRFPEHSVSECRVQASLRHHVHPPVEKSLHVHQECPKRQTAAPGRQGDQQVDVTRFIRVSASHRAEEADIAEAVSRC